MVRHDPARRRRSGITVQICEDAAGRRNTVVMFDTISASLYPGVAESFFQSGLVRKLFQLFSRAVMSPCTSM